MTVKSLTILLIGLNIGFLFGEYVGTRTTTEKINFDKYICQKKADQCFKAILGKDYGR